MFLIRTEFFFYKYFIILLHNIDLYRFYLLRMWISARSLFLWTPYILNLVSLIDVKVKHWCQIIRCDSEWDFI